MIFSLSRRRSAICGSISSTICVISLSFWALLSSLPKPAKPVCARCCFVPSLLHGAVRFFGAVCAASRLDGEFVEHGLWQEGIAAGFMNHLIGAQGGDVDRWLGASLSVVAVGAGAGTDALATALSALTFCLQKLIQHRNVVGDGLQNRDCGVERIVAEAIEYFL